MAASMSTIRLEFLQRQKRRDAKLYAELYNLVCQRDLLLDGKAAQAMRIDALKKKIQEHDPEVTRAQLKQREDDFEELSRVLTTQAETLKASVQEKSQELAAMEAYELRRQEQERENARFASRYANERRLLQSEVGKLTHDKKKLLRSQEKDRLGAIAARKEAQEYRTELQKLTDSMKELSKSQAPAEQQAERKRFLGSRVQALAEENARYRGEMAAQGEKIARMEDACARLGQAEAKVADLTKQLAARRDAANDSASHLATLASTQAELERQGKLLQDAQQRVEKLSSSAEAGAAALTDSRTQLSAALADLAKVRRELAVTKGQANNPAGLPAENEKVQELQTELEACKEQLTNVTAALQTQRQEAHSALQVQKQELDGMTDTITAAHDRASRVEQQLEAAKGENATALATRDAQISAMQQEGHEIWASLRAKETECEEIRQQYHSVSAKLAEAQQAAADELTVDELKTDLQRVYNEKHELSVQVSHLMRDGAQAKTDAESSGRQADSLSAKLHMMEQENARLSAELREQNRQSGNLNDQCKQLEDLNKQVSQSSESLMKELENANATIVKNDAVLVELRAQLSYAQQPNDDDAATTIIASKDATIASMKTDIDNLQGMLHAYMAEDQARQEGQLQQPQALAQVDPALTAAQAPQTTQMAFPGQPTVYWQPAQPLAPEGPTAEGPSQDIFEASDAEFAAMLQEAIDDLPEEFRLPAADADATIAYPDPTLSEGVVAGPPIFHPITGALSYASSDQDQALNLDPALAAAASPSAPAPSSSTAAPAQPQGDSSRKRGREDEPEHYPHQRR